MQKKTITLIMMLLMSIATTAQTDVSQYFIENYGFDTNFDYAASSTNNVAQEIKAIDGWTQDFTMNYTITGVYEFGFEGVFNSGSVPAAGYDGEAGGGLALSTGWGEEMKYYQTVTLPAGEYTVSVPTYNGFTASAGTSLLAWIPSSGTTVKSKVSSYPSSKWTLDQITFTLDKTTTGKIQIGYKALAGSGSGSSANLVIDYVQLLVENMSTDKTSLLATIKSANDYYGDGSGNGAEALKSAIDHAQTVADDESVDMIAVLEEDKALQQAIMTYRKSNVSEENPLDCTDLIVNPDFEDSTNGWAVGGLTTQTNTSFKKKHGTTYLEKWTASGSVGWGLVNQRINLPNGKYKLVVAAQNYTQSNTTKKNTGAYVYAGDMQTPVYTPDDYTVSFNCIAGMVEIGFRADDATGNWICTDNFRLYQVGYLSDADVLTELARLTDVAKELASSHISDYARESLQIDIAEAEKVLNGEQAFDPLLAYALQTVIEQGRLSKAQYDTLQAAIDKAETAYDETKEGAADFMTAIRQAKILMNNGTLGNQDFADAIEALETAELLFYVANGSGTAPKVTTITDFMIPAAHGGLIRATFGSGSFKERGICWSTEKEPTIADHRETDYYSQKGMLFHVKGMEPASVYYARAYAITNTYAVGYGDVIKVVTLPKGSCVGTWDNGAPDEAANNRCRTAIQETMDYLNEWTAIKGFTLSGHYGAQTPTADCSYGGYMRIGPNAGNQAIGTVIHETGHGVGVGTHWRWYNCSDTRANTTYGKWKGSWANKTLHFLENTTDEAVFMTGDGVHGWGTGPGISYDWFVNGADKDKHTPAQYIGGCALLYSLYVDGLCPTSGYSNGVPGYTFNFDDEEQYCIMCEDAERGLGEGFVYQRAATAAGWKKVANKESLSDSLRWILEYVPLQGYYRFKNVATGKYITHSATGSNMSMKGTQKPGSTENFQLMPGRNDITFTINGTKLTLPSYWFTWHDSADKSMQLNALVERTGYGTAAITNFDYSDKGGTKQRYVIIPASQVEELLPQAVTKKKGDVNLDGKVDISDIVAIINQIAGTATYENADVNEDEKVDISDIVAVINIIAAGE